MRQLKSHRLVISTRLHGHILCLLLGIPNIFLSNSYYKNQSFYEAWTHDVPFSKFVQDVSEVPEAIQGKSISIRLDKRLSAQPSYSYYP
ncbi:MAG: polysaccharide pyruvyl transferase family protein [Microcystis sp.]